MRISEVSEGDEFKEMMWAYRAVFKQTDVGGGTVRVSITTNERTEFVILTSGEDNYAAVRSINSWVEDTDGNTIARLMFPTDIDNAIGNHLTSQPAADIGSNVGLNTPQRLLLGKGDVIRLNAATLVQNEEFSINVRAKVRVQQPTVADAASAGTVTKTVDYDRVI